MKRLFLVTINIFLIGFCFGQSKKISNNIALTGGYSFYTVKTGNEHATNNGFPLGLSYALHIGDRIGVGMYSNLIYIPQSVQSTTSDAAGTVEGLTIKYGGDTFLFGFDFLMGPVFMLVNTPKIKMPFAVGFHFNLFMMYAKDTMAFLKVEPPPGFTGKIESGYAEINYGAGFNIGLEWYFSKKVYFLCRIQGSFDFINVWASNAKMSAEAGDETTTWEDSDFGFSNAWGFIPQVGIGIRF